MSSICVFVCVCDLLCNLSSTHSTHTTHSTRLDSQQLTRSFTRLVSTHVSQLANYVCPHTLALRHSATLTLTHMLSKIHTLTRTFITLTFSLQARVAKFALALPTDSTQFLALPLDSAPVAGDPKIAAAVALSARACVCVCVVSCIFIFIFIF